MGLFPTLKGKPVRCSLISGRLPRHFPPLPEGLSTTQMFWNPADNVSGFYGIPRNMTGIGRKLKDGIVGKFVASRLYATKSEGLNTC